MNKPYKDNVTLDQILRDGWSRGFDPEQTKQEAEDMGYSITIDRIGTTWQQFEDDMNEYFRIDTYRGNDDGWVET